MPNGKENLKNLHIALVNDEIFKDYVPENFNEFLTKYSSADNLKNLHIALVNDEIFRDYVPKDFAEASKKYGLDELTGKKGKALSFGGEGQGQSKPLDGSSGIQGGGFQLPLESGVNQSEIEAFREGGAMPDFGVTPNQKRGIEDFRSALGSAKINEVTGLPEWMTQTPEQLRPAFDIKRDKEIRDEEMARELESERSVFGEQLGVIVSNEIKARELSLATKEGMGVIYKNFPNGINEVNVGAFLAFQGKKEKELKEINEYFNSENKRIGETVVGLDEFVRREQDVYVNTVRQRIEQNPEFIRINELIKKEVGAGLSRYVGASQQELEAIQDELRAAAVKKYQDEVNRIEESISNELSPEFQRKIEDYVNNMSKPPTNHIEQSGLKGALDAMVNSPAFNYMPYDLKRNNLNRAFGGLILALQKKGVRVTPVVIAQLRDEFNHSYLRSAFVTNDGAPSLFMIKTAAQEQLLKIEEELASYKRDKPSATSFRAGFVERGAPSASDEEKNLLLAKEKLEEIMGMPDNMSSSEVFNFFRGLASKSAISYLPFLQGIKELASSYRVFSATKDPESPSNRLLLDAEALSVSATNALDNFSTDWYKAGSDVAESVPFMVEFAMTLGVGGTVRKSVEIFIKKKIGKYAETFIGKAMAGSLALVMQAAAQTSLNPQRYVTQTIDNMTPSIYAVFSENGDDAIAQIDMGSGMGGFEAAAKAYGVTFSEYLSENLGFGINRLGGALMNRGLQNEFFKRLYISWYMSKFNVKLPNAVDAILSKGGWNGFFQEYAEELFNMPLSNLIMGKDVFEGIWDYKNNSFDEKSLARTARALSPISIFGGVVSGGSIAIGAVMPKQVVISYNLDKVTGKYKDSVKINRSLYDDVAGAISSGELGRISAARANLKNVADNEQRAVLDVMLEKAEREIKAEGVVSGKTISFVEGVEGNVLTFTSADIAEAERRDSEAAEAEVGAATPEGAAEAEVSAEGLDVERAVEPAEPTKTFEQKVEETGKALEDKKADIEIGKVGNTNYEVKADGVYFGVEKLDNPDNKSHRQLIEDDIERRKKEEYLKKGLNNFAYQAGFKNRTLEEELNSRLEQENQNITAAKERNDLIGLNAAKKRKSEFEKNLADAQEINAKYNAELDALEQTPQTQADAIQEQAAGEVSAQPKAGVSEAVAEGKPEAKPKEAAKREEVTPKALSSVEETAKALEGLRNQDDSLPDAFYEADKNAWGERTEIDVQAVLDKNEYSTSAAQLSSDYHAAKAKPESEQTAQQKELIKAVEELLGKPTEVKAEPTKTFEQVSQKSGITPKNLRDLYNINRNLFELDRIKSLASAIAMDRMIGVMAKRAGVSKAEMYGRLKFEKASEQDLPQGALWQGKSALVAFDKWKGNNKLFSGSDVQDIKSGEAVIVRSYHGTTNEFYEFDSSIKGNVEGHLGKVNYFTTDYQDAANNYQAEGADLTNRIELQKERIEQKLESKYGDFFSSKEQIAKDYGYTKNQLTALGSFSALAKDIAEKELKGGKERVLDVFVKLNNPLVLGNKSTWFQTLNVSDSDIEQAAQEIADEYDISIDEAKADYEYEIRDRAIENTGYENVAVEALQKALSDNGYDSGIASEILGDSFYETEIDLSKIEQQLRSAEIYENEEGELASSQVIADFFKNLGYDGIILTDVSKRFKNMGLGGSTSHIHVFDEYVNQIKLADGTNTSFGETRDIRFQKSQGKAQGAVMVSMDGQAVIYALTDPNVSTPLHELAHVFEHYLTDAEKATVVKNAGTKGWTTETSEYFARGFEKYLAEGKAPTPLLQKIFDKFKQWLTDIYNGITGSDIDIELNDKMRNIYSKMLGAERVKPIKKDTNAAKNKSEPLRTESKQRENKALSSVEETAAEAAEKAEEVIEVVSESPMRNRNENAKPGEYIEYEDGGSIIAYERVGKDGKPHKKVKYNGGRAVSVTNSAYEMAINDILAKRALAEGVGFTPNETAAAMQTGFTQGDLFANMLGQQGTVTISGNVPSGVVRAVEEAIGDEVNENAEGVTDSEVDAVTNAERYADKNSAKDIKAKKNALNDALKDLKKMVKDNFFDASTGIVSKSAKEQAAIHFDFHMKMIEVAGLYFDLFVSQASEAGIKEFNSFRKFVEAKLGPSLSGVGRGFMLKQMELAFNTVKNKVIANEEMLPLTVDDVAIAMGLSGKRSNSAIVNGLSGEKAKANITFQSILTDVGKGFVDKQFGLSARSRAAIRALGKGLANWRETRMRDFFNATAGYRNFGAKVKTMYSVFYKDVYSNLGSLKIDFGDSKADGNVSKKERIAQYLNTYIFMRGVVSLEDRIKARVDKVDAFKQRVEAAIQSLGIPDVDYDGLKKAMVVANVKDPDSYDALVDVLGYDSIEAMQKDFRRYNNMEKMNNEVLKTGVISHGVINVNGSEVQVTYDLAKEFLDNVEKDQSEETARQLDFRANAYFDFQKNLLAYRLEMGEISTELYNELKDNDYMLRSWTAKEIVEAINLDVFNSGLRDKLTVQKAGGADGHKILRGGKPFASLGNDAMMATMLNLNASMRKVARNNMLMSFVGDYVPTIMAHVDMILEDRANALAKSGKSMSYVDRHLERVKSTLFYELNQVGVDEFGKPKFEDIDNAVAADMKLLGIENSFEDYEFYDATQKRTRKIKVHSDLAKDLFAYDEINPTVNKIGVVLSNILGMSILKPLAVNANAAFAIAQLMIIDPLHQSFVTDAHGWFWPAASLKAMIRATGYSGSRVKDAVAERFTGLLSKNGKFNRDLDDWVMHGGNMVTLASSFRTSGMKGFRDSSFSRFMDALQTLPETTELAMRLTTYSALRDKGIAKFKKANGRAPSGVELRIIKTHAANAANEAMDYGVSGSYTPVFNAVIPFFNATMRAFVSTAKYIEKNPALAAFKASQYLGLMVALSVFNKGQGDDDDKEGILGYNQFSIEDKKRSIYVGTPIIDTVNGKKKRRFIKVPTGTNVITGILNTLGDYVADNVVSAPSSSSRSYSKGTGMMDVISTLYTMSPVPSLDVAPALSFNLALFGNYDTFRGERIYKGKADVSPSLQYDEYTKRMFIDLAKLMDGFDLDSPPSAKQLQEATNKVFVLNNPITNAITNAYAITSEAVVPSGRVSEVEGSVSDFLKPFGSKFWVSPSSKPKENEEQDRINKELNNEAAKVVNSIRSVRQGAKSPERVLDLFVDRYKHLKSRGFNKRELNNYVQQVTKSYELSISASDAFVSTYMKEPGRATGGALAGHLKDPTVSGAVKKDAINYFVVVGKFNPDLRPTDKNYEGSFMEHVFNGSHDSVLFRMFRDVYAEEQRKFNDFKQSNREKVRSGYIEKLDIDSSDDKIRMADDILRFWYSLDRLSKKIK